MLMDARDEESGEGMTDHQLRDEVMTMFLAGHETTANGLTWTWYLLSQHPEVGMKLRGELRDVLGGRAPTVDDVPRLTYTHAVISESLRLYPPVWILVRRAEEDDTLGGYRVKRGHLVALSQYVTHRDPRFFKDPERFLPDRFLPGRLEALPKFAYFPFSGGPRQCIGNHFALQEMALVIVRVAQRYALELPMGHKVAVLPSVTLRPAAELRCKLNRLPGALPGALAGA
jgi:cytochrome P450